MNRPKHHHFVPQLLLRRWAGPDGRVTAWRRAPDGAVKSFRVLPSETARERGLYARDLVPPEERDSIEHGFFSTTVEARAGLAIEAALKSGLGCLDARQRFDLAVFMIASRVRLPENVHRARTEGRALIEAHLAEPDETFDRMSTGPERNLFEWANKHRPAMVANFGIDVIPHVIMHGGALHKLLAMPWMLADVSQASVQVLLSDRPLVALEGIDHPMHVQALALGPRHILYAARSPETLERLAIRTPRELVRAFNQDVVGQALRFAYGESKPNFIGKYLLIPSGGR